MNGSEHYREAERLLDAAIVRMIDPDNPNYAADRPSKSDASDRDCEGCGNLAAAQVHATLALAAATVEAADQQIDSHYRRPLVLRPTKADDVDGPFPGSPWGRAFYGDAS